jgi:hypothetical protein
MRRSYIAATPLATASAASAERWRRTSSSTGSSIVAMGTFSLSGQLARLSGVVLGRPGLPLTIAASADPTPR